MSEMLFQCELDSHDQKDPDRHHHRRIVDQHQLGGRKEPHPAVLAYPTWHVACVKVSDMNRRERAPRSDLTMKGRCRMYGNAHGACALWMYCY